MGGLLLAFLAEIGLITYRDLAGSATQKQGHTIVGLPLPADYLAACAIFGALGLVPKDSGAAKVATILGWGFVLATATKLTPALLNPSAQPVAGSSATTTAASSTQKATVV